MIRTRYFAYFYLLARLLPLMFGGLTQAALNKNPSLMSKSSPATKVGSSLNTTSLSFHPDLTLVQKRLITTITISSTSTDTTDCGCTESTTWLSTATVSSGYVHCLEEFDGNFHTALHLSGWYYYHIDRVGD
ncbi:hypothetical protein EYZ11_012746 [Aspergillus tanneri]|uniref:Uncharacterized protein n=1 Tax=Aspergillus tanneri TaxID=1220188 RepID=A0A4S3IZF0_9EURO|nr:hypothetical protein EYZ11_012746 [Aspergillus tanneri]